MNTEYLTDSNRNRICLYKKGKGNYLTKTNRQVKLSR